MLSKAVGAFIILGLFSPNMALADPTTVAVAPVAPVASTATAADVAQAGPLSDVPLNSWAYDAVDQLVKDGIVKGYPDGTFKGSRPMTRLEAATLAYRAVELLQNQIMDGKAVERKDLEAANKLIAAYGAEIKMMDARVSALQKEADATQSEADATKNALSATDKRLTGQVGVLNDFTKRAYVKFTDILRYYAYSANFNYNCGPGPYSGNGGAIGAYCASVPSGNTLLPGARVVGYGPFYTPIPGNSFPNGRRSSGVTMDYARISFTGTPSANTAFLAELSTTVRPSSVTGTSSSAGYCTPGQNFLNGNVAQSTVSGTVCTAPTAGQAAYNDGGTGFLVGFNNLWYQLSIPQGGEYIRIGHIQTNEGPQTNYWIGGDYFWGAMLGITNGPFNAYVAAGAGNAAVTNQTLDNIPTSVGKFVAEADYSFKVGKGNVNVGGFYMMYTGDNANQWDSSAVMCTGAGGTSRLFANTAAVPFTSCGAGFTPITYANGAPITGAYLSPANNYPTPTGSTVCPINTASPTCANFITPGLAVNTNLSQVGAHVILQYGAARLYLGGTLHLGNDPYTGVGYIGNSTGSFLFDYGPYRAQAGNARKWTYEAGGYANGINSLTGNLNYASGPGLMSTFTTNPAGLFWLQSQVKYWTGNESFISVGWAHYGLMPNTTIPAGGVACPGCVVTGYNQSALFTEFNINF
jgi:hypothetical protein